MLKNKIKLKKLDLCFESNQNFTNDGIYTLFQSFSNLKNLEIILLLFSTNQNFTDYALDG